MNAAGIRHAPVTIFRFTGGQTAGGSGGFISPEGPLMTNFHVDEGVPEVSIFLSDGSQ